MANVHPNAEKKILIIRSSRIHGLEWRKRTGFNIKVFSKGGLTYAELITIVNSKICDETEILILVGLQVELHSRTMDKRGNPGLVYANPTPPIPEIVSTLGTSDYAWKTRGITVVWVAPYTPNLVLHNEVRKHARNWGRLMPYEVEMAEHFEEIIERNRINLINRMKSENLDVLELELTPWHLTKPAGSDGLHLRIGSVRNWVRTQASTLR